jgi:RND family efflux transporter MFP subunit
MKRTTRIRIIVPIAVLLVGAAVMFGLIRMRKMPPGQPAENRGAPVEVMMARPREHRVVVAATGTVQPRREAHITPQVSGKVAWLSPRFIAGGFFLAGEELFRIEDVDYRLAVEQARAERSRAELDLATAESQGRIARQEWQRLAPEDGAPPNPLVLYEPQLKNARAMLAAADAALKKAELNLGRTVLRAPFNCVVRSEQIDVGQYLGAGVAVGQVFGTDRAEILVPLPLEELAWLQVPRAEGQGRGALASVRLSSGDRDFEWRGRVVRSLGEVDARGRMARLVVAVDDPFYLRKPAVDGRPPLSPGMFVNLEIEGPTLENVVPVPREALREKDTVWLAGEDGLLHIRKVGVVRRERQQVLVDKGLAAGDRIVLTLLGGVAEGLKLRIATPEAQP